MSKIYYELEKVRFYRFRPSKETILAKSHDLPYLIGLAKDVKIRDGKTYGEKVTICIRDLETDDILDYPYIRYVGEEI